MHYRRIVVKLVVDTGPSFGSNECQTAWLVPSLYFPGALLCNHLDQTATAHATVPECVQVHGGLLGWPLTVALLG